MINEKSLQTVKEAKFSKEFCRPLYSTYCFSQIPATIESLFTAEKKGLPGDTHETGPYDHVIFLFLDGFGWSFFEKYKTAIPMLKVFEKEGIVSKITSMFPSTTAAHVSCINTDLLPIQTGIYEWFIYEPKVRELIAPLLFSFAGDKKPGTLPLDPKELFSYPTFYERLQKKGIQSYTYQSKAICHSPFSSAFLAGSEKMSYDTPKEGLDKLLSNLNGKTYSYFYYAQIDSIGHRYGVYSDAFSAAIKEIFTELEAFYRKIPPRTALILSADHGMVEVSPKNTCYLNKKIPNIEKFLLFGKNKKPLAPAGSCRDFFLHVKEESLHELKEILEFVFKGKAEIYFTQELLQEKIFGPHEPSLNFLNRVGNLVILPSKGESVWWYEKNRFEQNFYAAHGGLTREEMEIPFLFLAC